jgi:hypothetical protein
VYVAADVPVLVTVKALEKGPDIGSRCTDPLSGVTLTA